MTYKEGIDDYGRKGGVENGCVQSTYVDIVRDRVC